MSIISIEARPHWVKVMSLIVERTLESFENNFLLHIKFKMINCDIIQIIPNKSKTGISSAELRSSPKPEILIIEVSKTRPIISKVTHPNTTL
jgi:hypothetical protein